MYLGDFHTVLSWDNLIINFSEGWGHFVSEGSSHNDHISLTGGGSEHDSVPKSIIIEKDVLV